MSRSNLPAYGEPWPKSDLTRVPQSVYLDEEIFAAENDRIFRGPTWNYLGLECEIPEPGDFVTTCVGTIPVVLNRASDGSLHAFVNRCAHRGAMVARENRGNCDSHTCIYHQWTYDHEGNLVGAPYRKGIKGNGGFPGDFRLADHALEKLRIESYAGVVFGTFDRDMEPLGAYMEKPVRDRMDALCGRPYRVTGYQRQIVEGNWKLYFENVKDCYHGSLLHMFNSNFGFFRSTQRGTSVMTKGGLHSILTTYGKTDEQLGDTFKDIATHKPKFTLEDTGVIDVVREHSDGMVTTILTLFPTFVLAQIGNHLGFRHVRPKGRDRFELVWINFEYEDDDEFHRGVRRKQGNLLGPSGYLAMEDAEALEIANKAFVGEFGRGYSFIEMGGRESDDQDHLVTEAPIRGFWRGYCDMMGIPFDE